MEKKELLRLSPSSINTYLKCPRRFYYSYILKLPQPSSIHLIKGIVVHTVFEKFFGSKIFRPDFEIYCEELFWTAFKEKEEEWDTLGLTEDESEQGKQDCLNIINIYLQNFRVKIDMLKQNKKATGDRHAFYVLRPKMKEVWLEDKELGLCGYADRIHTDFDGKVTIGDYKTSARYGIGMKDDYELQCGIYALLYYRIHKIWADKVSIIYLRYGEEPVTRVTPDLIQHTLTMVQFVRDNTWTKDITDYPKKETNFCAWCSWMSKCSGLEKKETEMKIEKSLEEMKNGNAKKAETTE